VPRRGSAATATGGATIKAFRANGGLIRINKR